MAESTVTQTESGAGLPRSRSVAKDFGVARYYTGKPCKHGHLSERSTSSGQCVACRMELQRRTKRDQSVYNETKRIWSQKNRQSVIEQQRRTPQRNKSRMGRKKQSKAHSLLQRETCEQAKRDATMGRPRGDLGLLRKCAKYDRARRRKVQHRSYRAATKQFGLWASRRGKLADHQAA